MRSQRLLAVLALALAGIVTVVLVPTAPPANDGPDRSEASDPTPVAADDSVRSNRASSLPATVRPERIGAATRPEVDVPVEIVVVGARGQHVSGAKVRAWVHRRAAPRVMTPLEVTADARDGRFWVVVPERKGGVLTVQAWADGIGIGDAKEGLAELEQDRVAVTLERLRMLTGRVLDPDGNPLVGRAEITLEPVQSKGRSSKRLNHTVFADAEGWFRRREDAPFGRYLATVEVPGWGRAAPLEIELERRAVSELGTVRTERGLVHRGQVLLPDGSPLTAPGVMVTALGGDPEKPESMADYIDSTPIDGEGRFVLRGLGPEPVVFEARGTNYQPLPGARSEVVAPARRATTLTAEVQAIEVVARDENAQPLVLDRLVHEYERSVTEKRANGLVPRLFELVRSADHYVLPAGRRVLLVGFDAAGRELVALVPEDLPPGRHRIELTPQGGEGIATTRLVLVGDPLPEARDLVVVLQGRRGGFSITRRLRVEAGTKASEPFPMPHGRYRLTLTSKPAAEGAPLFARLHPQAGHVVVGPDAPAQCTVRVEQTGVVTLRPGRAEFPAALRAAVQWRAVGDEEWRTARTAEAASLDPRSKRARTMALHGGATIDELFAPGAYELRVRAQGYRDLDLTFDVVAGEVADLELPFERAD